eukprot:562504-Lingulodinium_polyedra.AAC.1
MMVHTCGLTREEPGAVLEARGGRPEVVPVVAIVAGGARARAGVRPVCMRPSSVQRQIRCWALRAADEGLHAA